MASADNHDKRLRPHNALIVLTDGTEGGEMHPLAAWYPVTRSFIDPQFEYKITEHDIAPVYVIDYSGLLPLMSQETSTPFSQLGPISKPIARVLAKLFAAQTSVNFGALLASTASSGLALRLLNTVEELRSRSRQLVLSSPLLPTQLGKHVKASLIHSLTAARDLKNDCDRMLDQSDS